jgi:hypothetical protein
MWKKIAELAIRLADYFLNSPPKPKAPSKTKPVEFKKPPERYDGTHL